MAAVLDAFASKLADVLMGMAKEEVEMLLGVPGEITKLETTLGDLSSILADAERRRIRDSAVERWVRELKDVMYDADDILDLCQIMEAGEDPSSSADAASKTTTSGCWSIPRMLFCFRDPVVAHEIGKKIQALNQRLVDLEKRSSRFQFITQAINSSANNPTSNARRNSWSDDGNRKTGPGFVQSDIVGEKADESKKKLVDMLIQKAGHHEGSSGSNVAVSAAITGSGGIGKTTLARMVFNDATLVENFDKTVWLSINKEVSEIALLERAIASFGGDYGGLAADKALLEHVLKQTVRQKRFLLVMDDVWNEKVWNNLLRVPLSHGAHGSQVLMTTRNDGVARMMKAQYLHRVDKLEIQDAWALLKRQVVLNESDEADVDGLEDIGIRIVERCDGLPLAVKVLGGLLLNTSRTRGAWMDISNHFTWSMEGIDDDINKAIYLSYEELPSHLKQCFLFCSLFPKDELIRSGVIGQLWIAQGYIIHNKLSSKLPEDMAFEYYKELISRNLLEPDKQSYNHSACTMHDVVRSFAQYITKDEAVLISEGKDVKRAIGTSKLRHISISSRPVERDTLEKQTSLRTLMLFGSTTVEIKKLLNNLSCLRVLCLGGVNLAELPESICHLKHLRYLRLSCTSISTIPPGIGNLKHLQSIDFAGCTQMCQLPNSILKLRKLRSINFRGTEITSVPRGIGKLKDLVEMFGFPTHSEDSTDEWCSLEELGPLSKLQTLDITALEKAPSGSMAAKALLSSKHHLIYIFLIFTSRLGEDGEVKDDISEEEHKRIEDVLANLCPPTCIEAIDIEGYFARGLPKWMRTMSTFGSLRRLELKDYACCTRLPNGLGQLPFLDYFWVKRAPSIQCIGHDFLFPSLSAEAAGGKEEVAIMLAGTQTKMRQLHHISRDGGVAFPKLTELGLKGMVGWTEWEWEQHVPAMPALETLEIRSCKLQRLPTGLARHACRLRDLYLTKVQHLVSVENFPSLVKLWLVDNPRLERISNNPSLQWLTIAECPNLKFLQDVPSLRSIQCRDLDAEALPQYLQDVELNKLRVDCSPRLLKLMALEDESSEWGKIKHVQQVKAYGWKSMEDEQNYGHIYYTKEPYSFDAEMDESGDDEEGKDLATE